jgi:hypothetical protein
MQGQRGTRELYKYPFPFAEDLVVPLHLALL